MERDNDGQINNSTRHLPVLLDPILELFSADSAGPLSILDCTLGGGGHSAAFLNRWRDCKVTALDRDLDAINRSGARLAQYGSRFRAIHGNFADLDTLLPAAEPFDKILADFGFSSDQLDDPSRGFTFRANGPLDMRMDRTAELTADTVVNRYSPGQMASVFRRGGAGGVSPRLADAIMRNRPIRDTAHLAAVCRDAVRSFERRKRGKSAGESGTSDPATVPFQAIRIEVNGEFEAIERFLDHLPNYLSPGGTAAVITFHSLEDQLATRRMRGWSQTISHGRSGLVEREAIGALLTPKAVTASEQEIAANPRARSARLRAFRLGGNSRSDSNNQQERGR